MPPTAKIMTAPQTDAPPRLLRRKIAAILAADVAGYSRLVAEAEEDTLHALAGARDVFDALVRRSGGRIFNTAGDSVMCEFDSAVEGVRTAIDIQTAMAARNADVPVRRRLEFRMGLTIGDVVERDGDLLGDGVNIAARLEGLSPPGGLCVSRSVHEAVANKIAATFRDIGERPLKNLPQPIHAFVFEPPQSAVAVASPVSLPAGADFSVGEAPGRRRGSPATPAPTGRRRLVGPALVAAGIAAVGWLGYPSASKWLLSANHSATEESAASPPTKDLATRTPSGTPSNEARPAGEKPPVRAVETAKPDPTPSVRQAEQQPLSDAQPRSAELGKPAEPAKPAEKPFTLAEQAAAFTALGREGPVAEPSTPAEWYHNARLQEARDRPAALRSYAALLGRTGDFLDADLRFAALARAAGTAATARGALAEASRATRSPAPALAAAGLAEAADRRKRLEALSAANPDYAPAAYLLAEDYLSGTPTLTERRLAFDAFGQFADAAPRASEAAFMDRSLLASWREGARKRMSEIEASFAGGTTRPTATFARLESGWSATVTLPEPVLSATLRVAEKGEERSATPPSSGGARGGTRAVFELPGGQTRTTLYVGYTDLSGHNAGPFPIGFDPSAALIASEKETLERYPETWLTFRPDIADVAFYRQLVSNRCAITKVSVGYDGSPRTPLALPPCDEANPYAVSGDMRPVLTLPEGAERVEVQLTYTDGTSSAVRTFSRPAGPPRAKGSAVGETLGSVIEIGKGIGGGIGRGVGGVIGGITGSSSQPPEQ